MFVLRNSQIEAMKLPIRKRNRERMLTQLRANGFRVQEGEDRELAIADARGNRTRLIFDERYVPRKIIKPSGLEYGFSFDGNDQLAGLHFPGNEKIGFEYQDDLLKAILLNEGRIGLQYDDKGRITEVISQDGKGYRMTYDLSAKVSSITNRANEARHYGSIIQGNRLIHSTRDPLGRETRVETDPIGETADTIHFPDRSRQTSVYEEDLEALVTTLRNGAKVFTRYDGVRPMRVEWEDGNFLNLKLDGELVKAIENPAGTLRFEYDDKGRVLSEDFQDSTTRHNYDPDGNLLEIHYSSGLVVHYDYDEDGRLQALRIGEQVCNYRYGPNDTVTEIRYPNGLTQQRQERLLGGVQASRITDGAGTVLSQQEYDYDVLHRLNRYRHEDGSVVEGHRDWRFGYDVEGRLLESTESQTRRSEQFRYDGKGNMVVADGKPISVGPMDEVRAIGGAAVQYDANGNVSSFVNRKGQTVSLRFNDNNELKFARVGGETWEYWYDGLGRRVGKSNGREAWKFGWGGEKLLTEERRTAEGVVIRDYIYGHHAAVPVAFRENGNIFWLHSDVRGAVIQVFDNNGQVVWSAGYTSFGEALPLRGGIWQPWRLTGQYFDPETGLHYNLARYFSTHLRSFISMDKFWYKFEASNYGYAANDPYNRIDVNGNIPEWLSPACATVAGIASGIAVTVGIATIAPAIGAGVGATIAIGLAAAVIGGAFGSLVETVTNNLAQGKPILDCVFEEVMKGVMWGLLPLGKIFKVVGKIGVAIGKKVPIKAIKEAAERAAKKMAAKEAAEKATQKAADDALLESNQARKKAVGEAAEQEAKAKTAREVSGRSAEEAAEKQTKAKASREAADRSAAEAAEQEAKAKASREAADRSAMEAAEQEAKAKAAREAGDESAQQMTEQASRSQASAEVAERSAAEAEQQAARSQASAEAAERSAVEAEQQAARSQASAEAAERSAAEAEQQAMSSKANAEAKDLAAKDAKVNVQDKSVKESLPEDVLKEGVKKQVNGDEKKPE